MPEGVLEALIIDIKEVGAAVAGGSIARLGGTIRKTDAEAERASKTHGRLRSSLSGLKSIAGTTAMAVGATGLAAGLGEAIKNAQAMQASGAQLGNAIHTSIRKPAEGATEHLEKMSDVLSTQGGFNPQDNMQALAGFVRVTGSTTKATRDLTLATEISRGTHKSFETSVKALTMVENGRATSLRRLGIAISPVTTAQDKLHESTKHATIEQTRAAKAADVVSTKQAAIAMLQRRFAGATEAYGKTSSGAMNNFRNSIEVLNTRLGAALLPMITKVTQFLSKFIEQMLSGKGAGGAFVNAVKDVVKWLEGLWKIIKQNSTVLEILGGVILGVVAAMKAMMIIESLIKFYKMWRDGTIAMTAAQWALNVAMEANPIGLVVIAIGAIIGALVVAYLKIHAFRDAINAVWSALKSAWSWLKGAAVAVIQFVIHHWRLLILAIGPLGFAIDVVSKHFQFFKSIAMAVINWLVGAVRWAVGAINTVWSTLVNIFTKPFNTAKGIIQTVLNGILTAIRWIVDKVEKLLGKITGPIMKVAGKIGGVVGTISHAGGKALHFLTGAQTGGLVTGGGPFMVGERGPEIVTLPRGSFVTPNDRIGGGGGAAGDHTTVIYNILDGKIMSKSVVRQGLLQQSRS